MKKTLKNLLAIVAAVLFVALVAAPEQMTAGVLVVKAVNAAALCGVSRLFTAIERRENI